MGASPCRCVTFQIGQCPLIATPIRFGSSFVILSLGTSSYVTKACVSPFRIPQVTLLNLVDLEPDSAVMDRSVNPKVAGKTKDYMRQEHSLQVSLLLWPEMWSYVHVGRWPLQNGFIYRCANWWKKLWDKFLLEKKKLFPAKLPGLPDIFSGCPLMGMMPVPWNIERSPS